MSEFLAYAAFHFEIDQPVKFDGVFERDFFDDGFEKAVDKESFGIGSLEAAGHEVEEFFGRDLFDGGFVFDPGGRFMVG